MAEYYLVGRGRGGESEHYLGTTPNTDGEFPLRNNAYGTITQTFTKTPEGLILKVVGDPNTILRNFHQMLIDVSGKGSARITSHHNLKVEKAN